MDMEEKWIWLPEKAYPQVQTTRYSQRDAGQEEHYAVVSFSRDYRFSKTIEKVRLRFSGDTAFSLFCNGRHIANGPVLPGGDFLADYNDQPMPKHYASIQELDGAYFHEGDLRFWALVRLGAIQCFDYSRGHGGFFLTADILFADGTAASVYTDGSWNVQLLTEYCAPGHYDNGLPKCEAISAAPVRNIRNCETAPIPPCSLEHLIPKEGEHILISAKSRVKKLLTFDMICAGYLSVTARTSGELRVTAFCRELEERGAAIHMTFRRDGNYQGLELRSVGCIYIEAENRSDADAVIAVRLIGSHYPVSTEARTSTSDKDLDLVLKTCAHTLKYCRQSIHLDSPKHCEPLACTGDYYIETLMTAYSFGDMRLAAFDVRRTAELLRCRDGRMFHTSYSLIWVQMLMDVYRYTADLQLLSDCKDALGLLLERFHRYLGTNGIIEEPPDYMFIDWLVPDGISLHHPPKALGQTCLNMFYFGALKTAQDIYGILGEAAMADRCQMRMLSLQEAVTRALYDKERGLFFEGLNTPTREELIGEWMPRNVEKRYYRKHANILAAYFGFFGQEECAALLGRILEDDSLGQVQPYFCHYLLEAVYRTGLREKYTLRILEQWKEPVKACPKGLPEGFYKPEESYSFDHSHAWGGTPLYALPQALSGLEILEPGYQRIRLSPSLLGLEWAKVQVPTPYGIIEISMKAGTKPEITIPDGILLQL